MYPSGLLDRRNTEQGQRLKTSIHLNLLKKALEYEIKRQIKVIEEGGKIIQETRLWDSNKGITESMRGKEEAHDYHYFPEPDPCADNS